MTRERAWIEDKHVPRDCAVLVAVHSGGEQTGRVHASEAVTRISRGTRSAKPRRFHAPSGPRQRLSASRQWSASPSSPAQRRAPRSSSWSSLRSFRPVRRCSRSARRCRAHAACRAHRSRPIAIAISLQRWTHRLGPAAIYSGVQISVSARDRDRPLGRISVETVTALSYPLIRFCGPRAREPLAANAHSARTRAIACRHVLQVPTIQAAASSLGAITTPAGGYPWVADRARAGPGMPAIACARSA
jgi:hypothetical protein